MFRRFARKTFGNTDFEQIKGVLAHADCQNILEHRGTQRVAQRNTEKDCQNDWRNHKEHKGPQRDTKHDAGGGPCVRARRTSGPGACRAWRASHATLWERGGDAAPENGEQRTENRTPDKRATNEALCKVASAAKPSLQASKLPHNY